MFDDTKVEMSFKDFKDLEVNCEQFIDLKSKLSAAVINEKGTIVTVSYIKVKPIVEEILKGNFGHEIKCEWR